VQLAKAAGVDAPWGAYEAMMVASMYRSDPAAYRQWWERGHQVVVANGQRYLQLLAEAQRGSVHGAWDNDELIESYEQLQPEIQRHGDPMLVFLAANSFAAVLFFAGQIERAREVAQSAIEPGRLAGPISHCSALGSAAAVGVLSGDTDDPQVRATAAESLRIARDEGLTTEACHAVFVTAARAARRGDLEQAAVLAAGAAYHADRIGIGGYTLIQTCRLRALAAVDAHAGDLTAARRKGESMTLDELFTYTLEALE
jgi:hypothetical protein